MGKIILIYGGKNLPPFLFAKKIFILYSLYSALGAFYY